MKSRNSHSLLEMESTYRVNCLHFHAQGTDEATKFRFHRLNIPSTSNNQNFWNQQMPDLAINGSDGNNIAATTLAFCLAFDTHGIHK